MDMLKEDVWQQKNSNAEKTTFSDSVFFLKLKMEQLSARLLLFYIRFVTFPCVSQAKIAAIG